MKTPSKYNASLLLANGLTAEQCKAAEAKYLELLEFVFGSASRVRGAYVEYVAVRSLRAENPTGGVSPEELMSITRWEEAAAEATKVVFRQMDMVPEGAYFELHVWNSRTN